MTHFTFLVVCFPARNNWPLVTWCEQASAFRIQRFMNTVLILINSGVTLHVIYVMSWNWTRWIESYVEHLLASMLQYANVTARRNMNQIATQYFANILKAVSDWIFTTCGFRSWVLIYSIWVWYKLWIVHRDGIFWSFVKPVRLYCISCNPYWLQFNIFFREIRFKRRFSIVYIAAVVAIVDLNFSKRWLFNGGNARCRCCITYRMHTRVR